MNRQSYFRLAMIVAFAAVALPFEAAKAGPPYLTDDPEPTDEGHFEIYSFGTGQVGHADNLSQAGIDFNYGAAKDLQLTAVIPVGFESSPSGPDVADLGNIQI